jgi:Arc/MetJ-type ribon-helix-helix transcriptional regulator
MEEPDITIEEKIEGTEGHEIDVHSTSEPPKESGDAIEELAASVKEFAAKLPGSISKAVERALSGRDIPVMVRVSDEALRRIDQLVVAGIFKSRSESAAFLISEGVKAQAALFEQIQFKIEEIEKLRGELKNIIHQETAKQ